MAKVGSHPQVYLSPSGRFLVKEGFAPLYIYEHEIDGHIRTTIPERGLGIFTHNLRVATVK